MTDRFTIPSRDAPTHEKRAAIAAMNAIKLTIDQFESGWALYQKTHVRAFTEKLPTEAPMAALEDFCASENLFPADVAAAAILLRAQPIFLAGGDCVDIKAEYPETFASYILDPIDDEELEIEYDG